MSSTTTTTPKPSTIVLKLESQQEFESLVGRASLLFILDDLRFRGVLVKRAICSPNAIHVALESWLAWLAERTVPIVYSPPDDPRARLRFATTLGIGQCTRFNPSDRDPIWLWKALFPNPDAQKTAWQWLQIEKLLLKMEFAEESDEESDTHDGDEESDDPDAQLTRREKFQIKRERLELRIHRDEILWNPPHYAGEPRPEGYTTVPLKIDYPSGRDISWLKHRGFDKKYLGTLPHSAHCEWQEAAIYFDDEGKRVRLPRHTITISQEVFELVVRKSQFMAPQDVEDLRRILVLREDITQIVPKTAGKAYERLKKRAQRLRAKAEHEMELQRLIKEQAAEMAAEVNDVGDIIELEDEIPLVEEPRSNAGWWAWREARKELDTPPRLVDICHVSFPWAGLGNGTFSDNSGCSNVGMLGAPVGSRFLNRAPWTNWNNNFITVSQMEFASLSEQLAAQATGRIKPKQTPDEADENAVERFDVGQEPNYAARKSGLGKKPGEPLEYYDDLTEPEGAHYDNPYWEAPE